MRYVNVRLSASAMPRSVQIAGRRTSLLPSARMSSSMVLPSGEVEEGTFEAALAYAELADRDPGAHQFGVDRCRVFGCHGHVQTAVDDLDCVLAEARADAGSGLVERVRDDAQPAVTPQLRHRVLGDQPPPDHDPDPVAQLLHLRHEVAGEQDRATGGA